MRIIPKRKRCLRWWLMAAFAGPLLASAGVACSHPAASDGRPLVVTSFYPLEEAALRIGGDRVRVVDLTPSGVEPHDLELTPDDLETIGEADLILYLGGGFQPAVEDAVNNVAGGESLDLLASQDLHPDAEGDLPADPHVWLDPQRYAAIVGEIADALAGVDPAGADAYRVAAADERASLDALDAEFRDGLASCERDLLVTGHEAFGYLASAYDLYQVGVAGVSPEAEPGPQRLADISDLVRREGVTTVYAEELLPPEVIDTIAAETGVQVEVLHPIETLTDQQRTAGEDYGSLMRENLVALRQGLGCG